MKLIKLLTIVVFCGIMGLDVQADPLRNNQDKIAHAVTSFTISHVTYVICDNHFTELDDTECMITALVVAFSAGMLKETIYDKKDSLGDTGANLVGIGLSIPLLIWEY